MGLLIPQLADFGDLDDAGHPEAITSVITDQEFDLIVDRYLNQSGVNVNEVIDRLLTSRVGINLPETRMPNLVVSSDWGDYPGWQDSAWDVPPGFFSALQAEQAEQAEQSDPAELRSDPSSGPSSAQANDSTWPHRDLTLYRHGDINLDLFYRTFTWPFECIAKFTCFNVSNIILPGSAEPGHFPDDIAVVFWYHTDLYRGCGRYVALFQLYNGHYGLFWAHSNHTNFADLVQGRGDVNDCDIVMSLVLSYTANQIVAEMSPQDYYCYLENPLSNNLTIVG